MRLSIQAVAAAMQCAAFGAAAPLQGAELHGTTSLTAEAVTLPVIAQQMPGPHRAVRLMVKAQRSQESGHVVLVADTEAAGAPPLGHVLRVHPAVPGTTSQVETQLSTQAGTELGLLQGTCAVQQASDA